MHEDSRLITAHSVGHQRVALKAVRSPNVMHRGENEKQQDCYKENPKLKHTLQTHSASLYPRALGGAFISKRSVKQLMEPALVFSETRSHESQALFFSAYPQHPHGRKVVVQWAPIPHIHLALKSQYTPRMSDRLHSYSACHTVPPMQGRKPVTGLFWMQRS